MVEKYITSRGVNIHQFLSDYPLMKIKINILNERLEDCIDNSHNDEVYAKSSIPSDGVLSAVIRRDKIAKQVEEIKYYIKVLDMAIETLTQNEKLCIQEFFWKQQQSNLAVDIIAGMTSLEQSQIYRIRKAAMQKIENLIFS